MSNIDLSRIVTAEDKAAAASANLKESIRVAVNGHVEATARSRDYNGAEALASYVASTVAPWATEAQTFVAWRDAVWQAVYTMLAEVQAGERPVPADPGDVLAELPAIEWPAA